MNAYPVSNLINSPANNGKEIMEAIGERIFSIEITPIENPARRKRAVITESLLGKRE